jgi:predicted AlkP superfamily pyrophosphatase or phosphodiesterase
MFLRLLLLLTLLASAGSAAPASRPKLVVAILVDQMRYDYLERFHDQYGEKGFRMLMDQGAFLTFAHYDYIPTITGPGHASFLSGSPPAGHGIIANDWFDKATGKTMYCVSDPSVNGVGTATKAGQMSPRNFVGDNFSDEMRLHYRSKVIGISMKDRGAILPAGKLPAGAYWWESASGNFITSDYYRADLPEWVRKFNERKRAAEFMGQKWSRLLDPAAYEREDNLPGEGVSPGETTPTFDHSIELSKTEGFENIMPSPFGNQLLREFAEAALEGEQLGQGAQPDVFCISFSSVDYTGHKYGPYSQEVQDVVLRLDLELAQLFAALDKKVGLANCVIVLTADHAVAPTPEFARTMGFDAQRVDMVKLMEELLVKLTERFGSSKVLLTNRMYENNLYYNHDFLRENKIAAADVSTFIREWALATGYFQAGYSREQILDGRTPGLLGERVRNGFNAARSGDMVLVWKPYTLIAYSAAGKAGTTHGAAYAYDTHVPVLFYGSQFVRGRFADDFRITDIVPTLCAAMHITEPAGSIGKPLVKVLAGQEENASRWSWASKPRVAPTEPVAPVVTETPPVKATPPARATPKPRKK